MGYIPAKSIVFSIPDYYWDYVNEIKKINESDSTSQEKNRLTKKLEAKYSCKSHSIIWKREIPIDDFLSFMKFRKEEILFCGEDPKTDYCDPTEEQIEEATNFLKEITKGDHD